MFYLAYHARFPYYTFAIVKTYALISLFILFVLGFIILLKVFEGKSKEPSGFDRLKKLFFDGEFFELSKFIVGVIIFSALGAYFLFALIFSIPAIPTKFFSDSRDVLDVRCVDVGNSRSKGLYSVLQVPNEGEWSLYDYGHLCPKRNRSCKATVKVGVSGYYLESINCS